MTENHSNADNAPQTQPANSDASNIAQNDNAQKGKRKNGADGDRSKSTECRNRQSVCDFLKDCSAYEAAAVCASVHLSHTKGIEPDELTEDDRVCLNAFLNGGYTDATVDAQKVYDHRSHRAKLLWKRAQSFVNRETTSETCISLMGIATNFALMKQAKDAIEAALKDATKKQ